MKQMHTDFLLKKTSRLSGLARKPFAKIRGYSRFLSFLKTSRLGGFARKKKAFPQPKPRERKIIHIKKKSFRTFYERERRRRTATNASPPIPANNPNADGSGISGNGSVGFSDLEYSYAIILVADAVVAPSL